MATNLDLCPQTASDIQTGACGWGNLQIQQKSRDHQENNLQLPKLQKEKSSDEWVGTLLCMSNFYEALQKCFRICRGISIQERDDLHQRPVKGMDFVGWNKNLLVKNCIFLFF